MTNLVFDGTCGFEDYVRPDERLDIAYREVSVVRRDQAEKEAEAVRLLRSLGWNVKKPGWVY